EADTIIRKQTSGKKSLDDFCKKFHGGENTPPKVVPYTFDDIVAGMNDVAPYNWRAFFTTRLTSHEPAAPLGGLENSGWKLVFTTTQNEYEHVSEIVNQEIELQFSLGLLLHAPGGEDGDHILDVIPDSPAAKAGLALACAWWPSTAANGIQTFCVTPSPARRTAKSPSSCLRKTTTSFRPTGSITTAESATHTWNRLTARPTFSPKSRK